MIRESNCDVIHETILRDLVDIASDVEDTYHSVEFGKDGNGTRFKSLTSKASNLILVFPVLVSTNMDIDTAVMISKAIERKCTSLLQMILASAQISSSSDVEDYISNFHKNLNSKRGMTVDDYIDFMDDVVASYESGEVPNVDKELLEIVKEDMKNLKYFIGTAFNENSLNDYKIYNSKYGKKDIALISESKKTRAKSMERRSHRKEKSTLTQDLPKELGTDKDPESTNDLSGLDVDNDKPKNNKSKNNKSSKITTTGNQYQRSRIDFHDQILKNDIKKANEMMPTTLVVDITDVSHDTPVKIERAIIGVKAKLYPVNSIDIIEHISSKYVDNNWVRQIVRASTREISFWKDLIFAIDKAKIDALSHSDRGSSSPMWKVLERRATKKRLTRWRSNQADCSPITTLVISQEEVEFLKKNNMLNMDIPSVATKLMESYNLMGLIVADETTETVKMLFDGEDDEYETLSFKGLERESDDDGYKKVINLMTKLSR